MLHTEEFKRQYRGGLGSPAGLCWLLAILATAILPFVLAFASGAFWLRLNAYSEQPSVRFKDRAIVAVGGTEPGSTLAWTSFQSLNHLLEDRLLAPTFEVATEDENLDGKPDAFRFFVSFPAQSQPIHSFRLMAFFHVSMNDRITLDMEGLAFFDCSSPAPGSRVYGDGRLVFVQRELLFAGGSRSLYNTSLFDPSLVSGTEDITFEAILRQYNSRNETMQLENTVCLWQGGRSGRFQFEGVVRIPESDVRYLPTGWEAFKFAWIQYLAFLVVVGWIAFSLKGLLIQSHWP